jgi:hypothetical protein
VSKISGPIRPAGSGQEYRNPGPYDREIIAGAGYYSPQRSARRQRDREVHFSGKVEFFGQLIIGNAGLTVNCCPVSRQ